jgi:hypothetical protein
LLQIFSDAYRDVGELSLREKDYQEIVSYSLDARKSKKRFGKNSKIRSKNTYMYMYVKLRARGKKIVKSWDGQEYDRNVRA